MFGETERLGGVEEPRLVEHAEVRTHLGPVDDHAVVQLGFVRSGIRQRGVGVRVEELRRHEAMPHAHLVLVVVDETHLEQVADDSLGKRRLGGSFGRRHQQHLDALGVGHLEHELVVGAVLVEQQEEDALVGLLERLAQARAHDIIRCAHLLLLQLLLLLLMGLFVVVAFGGVVVVGRLWWWWWRRQAAGERHVVDGQVNVGAVLHEHGDERVVALTDGVVQARVAELRVAVEVDRIEEDRLTASSSSAC